MAERDEQRTEEPQEEQQQELEEHTDDETGSTEGASSAVSSRKAGESLTLDDARELVDDAVKQVTDGYDQKRDAAYQDIANKLVTLEDNDKKILENSSQTKTGSGTTATVCVLEQTQYEALEYCYHYAQGAAGVLLFLMLVNTLMVAALFGNRLWAAFSEGWRH